MSTDEKARELLAQQRQQAKHLADTMLDRAEEGLESGAEHLQEQAREVLTEGRQQAKHLTDTMRERAEADIHR